MNFESAICKHYDRLNLIETSYDAFKLLRNISEIFGYTNFSIIYVPNSETSELSKNTVVSNWPPELVRAYDEMGLLRNSPIIKSLRASSKPIEWELMEVNKFRESAEIDFTVDLFRDFGLLNGVYFPAHDSSGRKGAVSFAGDRPPLSSCERAKLHLLSFYMFSSLSDILTTAVDSPPKLTARELECLRWASEGKTSAETAKILKLSENTISGHVTSACKKLSATGKVHAVAKCIRLGLLD